MLPKRLIGDFISIFILGSNIITLFYVRAIFKYLQGIVLYKYKFNELYDNVYMK